MCKRQEILNNSLNLSKHLQHTKCHRRYNGNGTATKSNTPTHYRLSLEGKGVGYDYERDALQILKSLEQLEEGLGSLLAGFTVEPDTEPHEVIKQLEQHLGEGYIISIGENGYSITHDTGQRYDLSEFSYFYYRDSNGKRQKAGAQVYDIYPLKYMTQFEFEYFMRGVLVMRNKGIDTVYSADVIKEMFSDDLEMYKESKKNGEVEDENVDAHTWMLTQALAIMEHPRYAYFYCINGNFKFTYTHDELDAYRPTSKRGEDLRNWYEFVLSCCNLWQYIIPTMQEDFYLHENMIMGGLYRRDNANCEVGNFIIENIDSWIDTIMQEHLQEGFYVGKYIAGEQKRESYLKHIRHAMKFITKTQNLLQQWDHTNSITPK